MKLNHATKIPVEMERTGEPDKQPEKNVDDRVTF